VDPIQFRLFGFPVRVEPSFFLTIAIALLFQLSAGGPLVFAFTWGAVVFVSVLVHELGHALVARSLRVPVGTISLHALGGQVQTGRTSPARSLAVSLGGPGAGLSLGLVTLALVPLVGQGAFASRVIEDLLWVNLGWSMFNLLPLYPLDGGNAMRSGLALVLRETQAWRITAGTGVILGAIVLVFGLQSHMMIVTYLGGFAIWQNWQILNGLPG
jgi:stage IV sporulation protein FB